MGEPVREVPVRTLAVISSLVLLAACGGGSSSSSVGNTIGGHPFTVAESRSVTGGSASPCTVTIFGQTKKVGVTGLKIDLASYANVCGDYPASGACVAHSNAQLATIIIARLRLATDADPNPAAPALEAGDYTVQDSPAIPYPGPSGVYDRVTYAAAVSTGATCSGATNVIGSKIGGTVHLDDPAADPVTGTYDLTFASGERIRGSFQAPRCPGFSPDICLLAENQTFCNPQVAPVCTP